MNRKLSTTLIATVLAVGTIDAAQLTTAYAGEGAHQQSTADRHAGEGEVTKIDRNAGRIELKHEPIQSLGWPAMRMAFRVTDPKLLDGIETGQRVRFTLSRSPDGSLKISELSRGN